MTREPLEAVPRHLRVEAAWEGLTVVEAVRRAFPEVGAREVFRKARTGEVLRNDEPCLPLDPLREGDVVRVILFLPVRPAESTILREDVRVDTAAGPLFIVREDEDLLAVSKPSGCASHPALRRGGDTLVERIRRYLGGCGAEADFRPALANRLDIETSGIVLVGKNRAAQRKLGFLLQRKQIEKRYLLLAVGRIERDEGEITLPLERHPDSRDLARHRQGHPLPEVRLQHAHTRYRVIARAAPPFPASFVEVELVTGRTHQIRRHFAAIGHPVVMDRRYGDRERNAEAAARGVDRMFLHAGEVGLPHPRTGRPVVLTATLPEELRAFLRGLGISWEENKRGSGGETTV